MRSAGFGPSVHFVERSPVLRTAQAETVPHAQWHEALAGVPEGPLLVIANEFLDALPVRQFVDGVERKVVVVGAGLALDRDGEIIELSPAREQAVAEIAKRLVESGGAALIIDYGHERSAAGETLQAVRGHSFAPLLDRPGEQDLTAHVDFEAVAKAAREAGAVVTRLATQGQWLEKLGIASRASSLASAHPDRSEEIDDARRRLCDSGQMGDLSKVIAIHSPDWSAPAGFE
jgi:SAM-dependent MidA family methyltransferase